MTTIKLDWFEVYRAATVGAMRRIHAMKKQRPGRFPPRDAWGVDIEGACAELAVARLLKTYWHAIVSDPEGLPGDAGVFQVRSTTHENGQLVVYEHDDPAAAFVLVTGRAPTLEVRGWLLGSEAKQDKFWRRDANKPAWFVPQSELRPMSQIKHAIGSVV